MFLTRKINSNEYKFFVHYVSMTDSVASLIVEKSNLLKTHSFQKIYLSGLVRRRYMSKPLNGKLTGLFYKTLDSITWPSTKNTIIDLTKEKDFFENTKFDCDYDISDLTREKNFSIDVNTKDNNQIYIEFDTNENTLFIETNDYSENYKTLSNLLIKLYQANLIIPSDKVILDLKYRNLIESTSETGGILFIRKLFELIVKNKYNKVLKNLNTGGVS